MGDPCPNGSFGRPDLLSNRFHHRFFLALQGFQGEPVLFANLEFPSYLFLSSKCVDEGVSDDDCTNWTGTTGFLEGEGKFGFKGYNGNF